MESLITSLHQILNSYSPVSAKVSSSIFDAGVVESANRNDIVFQEKRSNAFEYFQLKGVSHRYNIGEKRRMLTSGIYQNDTVITPHFTRTRNGQSVFSLQALTECIFLKVPAGAFRDFIEQNPEISAFGRAVVENEFIRTLQFETLLRASTAKERLLDFRLNYPGLENIIPHTVIASFLGITPVSFSRLRNELATER